MRGVRGWSPNEDNLLIVTKEFSCQKNPIKSYQLLYIYIYIYVCVCVCVFLCVCVCVCVYLKTLNLTNLLFIF